MHEQMFLFITFAGTKRRRRHRYGGCRRYYACNAEVAIFNARANVLIHHICRDELAGVIGTAVAAGTMLAMLK